MQQLAPNPPRYSKFPCGWMSLGDVMKNIPMRPLLLLQQHMSNVQSLLVTQETVEAFNQRQPVNALLSTSNQVVGDPHRELNSARVMHLMNGLRASASLLGLDRIASFLEMRRDNPPKTAGELGIINDMMLNELDQCLFFLIPENRKQQLRVEHISDAVKEMFPEAVSEILEAGHAYMCGLNTASVFHAMRACETALPKVAKTVGVSLETENWKVAIDKIIKAIRDMENQQAYAGKKEQMQRLSEMILHLGLIKDAWRNHVSHAKVFYTEPQAIEVFESTCRFFARLVECPLEAEPSA